jgi:hypothetical protein
MWCLSGCEVWIIFIVVKNKYGIDGEQEYAAGI